MGDITVAVYCRPPDQLEEVDEAFYRAEKEPHNHRHLFSWLDFNDPGICWKSSTARHTQSRILQSIDDSNTSGGGGEKCIAGPCSYKGLVGM